MLTKKNYCKYKELYTTNITTVTVVSIIVIIIIIIIITK